MVAEEVRSSETTQTSVEDIRPKEIDGVEDDNSPVSNHYIHAMKLIGQHRASDVAVTFLTEQMAMVSQEDKFAQECRVIRREVVNFQRLTLKAEVSLMDYIEEMSCDQLLRTLFDLFDIDWSRSLDDSNLAHCLSRLDSNKSFEESMKIAKMSMLAFDADGDGVLNLEEFTEFITSMSNNMNCSLEDMCKFLLARNIKNGSGETALRDVIKYQKSKSNSSVARQLHGCGEHVCRFIEARIAFLFKLLDYRGTGNVDIGDVEKSLSQILNELSNDHFRKDLFENDRKLDYEALMDLLVGVVAASSANIDIDDVCNSMTLVLCDPDLLDSKQKLKRRTWTIRRSLHVDKDAANNLQTTSLEKDKINKIFDLWDTDQDGEIGFEELFLAWRKMHGETKKMEQTFDECINVISKFEFTVHRDQKLDKSEFGAFLAIFSDQTGEDLISMLDYMVVRSALQDNTEEERKFIEKKKSVAQKKLLGINPSKGALWSRWGVFGNTSFGSTRSIQQVDAVDEWLDETNINAPPRDSTGTEIPTSNEIEEKEMEDMREKTHMIVDFKRLPPSLDQQTNGEDGFLAKIFGSVRRVSTDDGLRRSKSAGAKS